MVITRKMSVFVVLLVALWCGVAMAQTFDPSLPLWGWHWTEISFVLGAIVPFLNSLIAKNDWASEHKEYLIAGISFLATVGVGVYINVISSEMFSGDQIIATFAIIIGMSQVVYKAFKGFFKNLGENFGNGASKKN